MSMMSVRLIPYYLFWHYVRAPRELTHVVGNMIWFVYNFFSLPLLVQNLFTPFLRLHEVHHPHGGIADYLSTLFINFLMRIVGAVVRIMCIFVGMFFLISLACLGVILCLLWLVLPALFLALLVLSFKAFF